MTEKSKTVVVIETHEQTIVRRTTQTVAMQASTQSPVARLLVKSPARGSWARWWSRAALRSARVLAPWSWRR
jgi:hypothetical protein